MSLTRLNSLYDNFLDSNDFFSLQPSFRSINKQSFNLDVKETDNEFIIKADLPGVDKSNIEISLEDNILTISTERKNERKETEDKYHYFERSYGKYSRSISLPSNINSESLLATYTNGVLNLSIPKNKTDKKQNRIPIQ
jgi:HSP20 family protein